MKKNSKLLMALFTILLSFSPVISYSFGENQLSTIDRISIAVYCFFTNCPEENIQNQNSDLFIEENIIEENINFNNEISNENLNNQRDQ